MRNRDAESDDNTDNETFRSEIVDPESGTEITAGEAAESLAEDSSASHSNKSVKRNTGRVSKGATRETGESSEDEEAARPKIKPKYKSLKDKTVKTPLSRGRGKHIEEVVSKEVTDQQIDLPLENWLRMSGQELSKCCLDYLAELERQRCLCNNLCGRIDGRMKSC